MESWKPMSGENNQPLHLCSAGCGCEMVYPLEDSINYAVHDGVEGWEMVLRCPECEHFEEGFFDVTRADHFDEELCNAREWLYEAIRKFGRQNTEEWVDNFVQALHDDHILPEDF